MKLRRAIVTEVGTRGWTMSSIPGADKSKPSSGSISGHGMKPRFPTAKSCKSRSKRGGAVVHRFLQVTQSIAIRTKWLIINQIRAHYASAHARPYMISNVIRAHGCQCDKAGDEWENSDSLFTSVFDRFTRFFNKPRTPSSTFSPLFLSLNLEETIANKRFQFLNIWRYLNRQFFFLFLKIESNCFFKRRAMARYLNGNDIMF